MKGKKLSAKEIQEQVLISPSLRKTLFKELLDHLKNCYSMDCFPPLSEHTIMKLVELFPEDFCPLKLQEACRQAKGSWELIGHRQANGLCLGNSRSWYYNMSNRYGWSDRQEIKNEHKGSVQVQVVNYSQPK